MSNANEMATQAVIDQIKESVSDEYTLSTGIRVKLKPVSIELLRSVASKIKEPTVPMVMNQDKGREEPNPDDPEYKRQVATTNEAQFMAVLDVVLIEGMELLEEIPDVNDWWPSLQLLQKLGHIQLPDNLDLDNQLEREYLYKKFKAIGKDDLNLINRCYGISQEDVSIAEDTFRDN